MRVGYGCCVGSWERFAANVVSRAMPGAAVLGLSGQTSIADAYNDIMVAFAGRGLDMVILQHDDLEILDPDHVAKFAAAFEAGADIVGVAGGSARGGLAWWNHDPIGHQDTDARMIDFGARTGRVDLLEGSILAISTIGPCSRGFISRPGFHGYDEIAMVGKAVVVDVATRHHTTLGFDNESSHQDWLAADQWFRQKWGIA